MSDRPNAAPAWLLAERDELAEQRFALGGSDEFDDERRKVEAKLEALHGLIDAQRFVGVDVLLAGMDPEKAQKIRTALGMLGAKEVAPAWLCTCCGIVTPIKLKGVPLCASCGVNLIEERGRRLKKGADDALLPFPIAGTKCNKRGHRPTGRATR